MIMVDQSMQRNLLKDLINWKNQEKRKPLLIDGARQTGKTYLLANLFGQSFDKVLRIDFLESPEMAQAFQDSLNPSDILDNLSLLTGEVFNPDSDLLILDEIGECPQAVTSLKFFAEKSPKMYVVASGSNIGLLNSFPVGKVEQYNLRPLTFREFLMASGDTLLLNAFNKQMNTSASHSKLFNMLTDYYFVGGMPEAVKTWFSLEDKSLIERVQAVSQIHQDLISGYERDFGKYGDKTNATLLQAVFENIPTQLSAVLDDSVKRFRFKEVYPPKSRYTDFESAIQWLIKCRLALPNYPLDGQPKTPLKAYRKPNQVKLFLFDVGLLGRMLSLSYQEIKQQGYDYKGFMAENFVQQELVAQGIFPTYSWGNSRAEIEFILPDEVGNITPIEVKSGKRTKAKSLQSYIIKFAPKTTIKLTGTQGSSPLEKQNVVLPLYYVEYVVGLMNA